MTSDVGKTDLCNPNVQAVAPTPAQAQGVASSRDPYVEIIKKLFEYEVLLELDHSLSNREINQVETAYLDLCMSLPNEDLRLQKMRAIAPLIQKVRTIWRDRNRVKQEKFTRLMKEGESQDSPTAVLKIIQSAKPSWELFFKAKTVHPHLCFSFSVGTSDECGFRTADCDHGSGKIRIRKAILFEEKIICSIFELANLCNSTSFNAVQRKVLNGEIIDVETYAKAIERLEHENSQRAVKTMQACIETAGWDPDMGAYLEEICPCEFEDVYALQKKLGHTDLYRTQFHLLSKDRQDLLRKKRQDDEAVLQTLQMSPSDLQKLNTDIRRGVKGEVLVAFIGRFSYVPSMSTFLTECYDNTVIVYVNYNGQKMLQYCTLRKMFEQSEEGEWTLQAAKLFFGDSESLLPSSAQSRPNGAS